MKKIKFYFKEYLNNSKDERFPSDLESEIWQSEELEGTIPEIHQRLMTGFTGMRRWAITLTGEVICEINRTGELKSNITYTNSF